MGDLNDYNLDDDLKGEIPDMPPLPSQSYEDPPVLDRRPESMSTMNGTEKGGRVRRAKSKSACKSACKTCKSKPCKCGTSGGCPCDGGKSGGGSKKRSKSKGKKRSKSKGKK